MTRISVAMASYNGADWIGAQLESILEQTRLPDEIVITDDGSTDGTVAAAQAALKGFSGRVRVETNPARLGYRQNFLKAFGLCTGDLVAFCDQDDLWKPGKLAAVEAAAQADPRALVLCHNFEVVDAEGRVTIPDYYAYIGRHGKRRQDSVKGCAMTVRKSALPGGLLDAAGDEPHDGLFMLLGLCAGAARFIDTPLISHRLHDTNTSGRITVPVSRLSALYRRVRFRARFGGSEAGYYLSKIPEARLGTARALLQALEGAGYDCSAGLSVIAKRLG